LFSYNPRWYRNVHIVIIIITVKLKYLRNDYPSMSFAGEMTFRILSVLIVSVVSSGNYTHTHVHTYIQTYRLSLHIDKSQHSTALAVPWWGMGEVDPNLTQTLS